MYIYIKVDVCIYMYVYIYIYKMIAAAQPVWRVSATSNARKGSLPAFAGGQGKGRPGKKERGGGHSGASSIPWPLIRGPLPSPSPSRQVQLR